MKKLIQFFQRLFSKMLKCYQDVMSKARPFLQKEIPVAVKIVEALKKAIDSPLADIATAIFPGKVDDIALNTARQMLPMILLNLGIARNIAKGSTNDEIIQAAIAHLRELKLISKSKYGKTLLDIAAEISHALTDGKITLSELAAIIHCFYESQKAEIKQAA